jgi:hypothetical protein
MPTQSPTVVRLPRVFVVSAVLLTALLCWAGKKVFVMPSPQPAKSYPAHDAHSDEGVTVALDPYDMPDKVKIFSVKYSDVDYLPIFMVITNDTSRSRQTGSCYGRRPLSPAVASHALQRSLPASVSPFEGEGSRRQRSPRRNPERTLRGQSRRTSRDPGRVPVFRCIGNLHAAGRRTLLSHRSARR